jgi:hypothetical protein
VLKGVYQGAAYLGDNPSNPIVAIAAGEDFSLALAQDVDHLVLQDADQPGLELAAVVERLRPGQRREQGFGDRILGPRVIAQLQAGEPQQVRLVLRQLALEGHARSGMGNTGAS